MFSYLVVLWADRTPRAPATECNKVNPSEVWYCVAGGYVGLQPRASKNNSGLLKSGVLASSIARPHRVSKESSSIGVSMYFSKAENAETGPRYVTSSAVFTSDLDPNKFANLQKSTWEGLRQIPFVAKDSIGDLKNVSWAGNNQANSYHE